MFENLSSLSVSGPGRSAAPRLEALEDRTTPTVTATFTNPFAPFATANYNNPFASGAAALNGQTVTSGPVDQAYLSEVARISVMEWFFGTTVATQGFDPQIRAFGQQLASNEFALFNQVFPVLTASGIPLQLTPIDQALINALPTLVPTDVDSQFLFLSSLYGLQAFGQAQTEAVLGTNLLVRSFAQSQLAPLQNQLQFGFTLLGPTGTNTTLNTFTALSGSGPFSAGLGTGFVPPPFGTVILTPAPVAFTFFVTGSSFGLTVQPTLV